MLIVIPFDLPWEHTADYAHQTARELAKGHTVICYMQKDAQSVKEYIRHHAHSLFWVNHVHNMYLYYPLYLLPFRRFQFIELLNSSMNVFIMRTLIWIKFSTKAFYKKILWIFYPEYVWMIPIFGNSYESVYDCVDYHIGSSPYKKRRELVRRWEHALIQQCTYFFVNSHVLFDIHKKKRADISLVPQGFRLDVFKDGRQREKQTITTKPIIGYVGGINFRLDYSLLLQLISKTPEYLYCFVGPIQENDKIFFDAHIKAKLDRLFLLPNVQHVEALAKEEMPAIISSFDVAIIPYDAKQEFNSFCYPMKLFEYFYMGKPVVSTSIKELKRFPKFIKFGDSVEEWEKNIREFLSKSWPESYKSEQRRLAIKNSWENKVDTIISMLDASV